MLCGKPPRDQRTVMYRVYMKEGKAKKVEKVLRRMDSVEEYQVDEQENKVTVTGYVDPKKLAHKLERKSGHTVELWTEGDPSSSPRKARSSWGPTSSFSFSSRTTHMFDDENPNSCSIM